MANLCTVDGCTKRTVGQGLCRKHYVRMQRKGTTDDVRKNARPTCKEAGCTRKAAAFHLCQLHYRRQQPKYPRQHEGRFCDWCAGPISSERRAGTRFCSSECKTNSCNERAAPQRSANYYRDKYGLTLAEVKAMRAAGCGICGTTDFPGQGKQGHIDHCHTTGKVRGVLCQTCNTGLGMFKDSPELLERAAVYLCR